jgi:hypothetical protein
MSTKEDFEMKLYQQLTALSLALCAVALSPQNVVHAGDAGLDRTHLPMLNTPRPRTVVYDARNPDSKNPPIEQLRPPKGAPNVLVILIDDCGFGSTSAYGGPCADANVAEKLAAGGLKYNRFHTTAICSRRRARLAHRPQPP